MGPIRKAALGLATLAGILLAAIALGACGGDESGEPDPGSTAADQAVDAEAFKACIFSGLLNIGVYEEVKDPSPALAEASAEAEFFEAGKGDDGLVAFYVFDDEEKAEAFATGFEATLDDYTEELTEGAGVDAVKPSVETKGSVVLGLIPFTPDKEKELPKEALADVSTCLEESADS